MISAGRLVSDTITSNFQVFGNSLAAAQVLDLKDARR
jgi:hypothetical protein